MFYMHEEKVKQHIVPQRYLYRFAEKNNQKYIIETRLINKNKATNKNSERFFSTSTDNVGYVKRIYDVTDKDNVKYWEDYFGNYIDSLYGDRLDNIIAGITLSNNGKRVLTTEDKADLSKMIVAQIMRSPEIIYHIQDIYKRFPSVMRRNISSGLPPEHIMKYRYKNKYIGADWQQLKNLYFDYCYSGAFDNNCGILQEYVWTVYYNTLGKECPFITSDNPVLVENTNGTKIGLFKNGFESSDTCIFYPLSPTIAVALYSREGLRKTISDKIDCQKIEIDELNFILKKNLLIIAQAHRHSFVSKKQFYQWYK